MVKTTNIGALIIRIGFGGVYYTRIIIRNPRNPIPIIKAPTLRIREAGQRWAMHIMVASSNTKPYKHNSSIDSNPSTAH